MTVGPERWILLQRAATITVSPGDRALRAAAAKGTHGQTWRGVVLKSRVVVGRGGRDGIGHLELGLAELIQALPDHAEALAAATTGGALPVASAGQKRGVTKRSDWGAERLLFLRRLFKAADLSAEVKAAIETDLHQEVCCLWAGRAGRVGWRRVATWASDFLYDLAVKHGASLAEPELRKLCRVPKSYVTRWERRKHRKTDTWLHDRQTFNAAEPGVRRKRPEWPLDLVYGDGTALDIRVLRPDGSESKVWLILWLDAATNRLFGHCLARPKGGGVTQQHIGFSLICLASAAGMPRAVYAPDGRFIGLVYSREWQENDRAGAREAGRLKTLRRQGARELERAAPPADVQPYQAKWLERHAPPDEAPPGELFKLPGERGKAAAARRALPAPAPEEVEDHREIQMRLLREFGAKTRAAK